MTQKQKEELETSLLNFVKRVSNGDAITEAETNVLPAVVQNLIRLDCQHGSDKNAKEFQSDCKYLFDEKVPGDGDGAFSGGKSCKCHDR